jgi:NAD+ kinase
LWRTHIDTRRKSLVITPIAPHNLNARPLVIPDETEIRLKVSGREEHYLVSLDSRITSVKNESILTIKKTPFEINMVELPRDISKTLRTKLLWGEDKRNSLFSTKIYYSFFFVSLL